IQARGTYRVATSFRLPPAGEIRRSRSASGCDAPANPFGKRFVFDPVVADRKPRDHVLRLQATQRLRGGILCLNPAELLRQTFDTRGTMYVRLAACQLRDHDLVGCSHRGPLLEKIFVGKHRSLRMREGRLVTVELVKHVPLDESFEKLRRAMKFFKRM